MGKIQTLLGEASQVRAWEESAEVIVAKGVQRDNRSEGPKESMQLKSDSEGMRRDLGQWGVTTAVATLDWHGRLAGETRQA